MAASSSGMSVERHERAGWGAGRAKSWASAEIAERRMAAAEKATGTAPRGAGAGILFMGIKAGRMLACL